VKGKPQRARLGDLLRPQQQPQPSPPRVLPVPEPTTLHPLAGRAETLSATDTSSRPPQKQLNVLVNVDVHRRAKAKASLEGVALGAVLERLLREWLGDSTK
jgi:hypothetical protein